MLYRFGECSIDTARLEVWRAGLRVALEPQARAVLIHLLENRDRVVSRDEIFRTVWHDRIVSDGALSVTIRMVRAALGDDGHQQSIIRTVQRGGYRFVAEVTASAGTSLVEGASAAVASEEQASQIAAPGQPSIVVLPLQPIGEPSLADILAQGLTCDVTTGIGRSGVVAVIARGTAMQFGSACDVRDVGRKLGVRYAVQGAVQVIQRRMRVTVALVDAGTQHELWSERYEARVEEAMQIQREIAELLVSSLQEAIERAESKRALLLPSTNLDAWTAYHRGAAFMFRFRADECAHAEYFFRRAIELDPAAPRAYAGLSFVHFQRAFMNMGRDRDDDAQRARDIALQGVAADAFDPMAHWALGRAYLLRGDADESIQEFRKAITLNPSYAGAHYSMGWAYMLTGDRAHAQEGLERARQLSPLDPLIFAMRGVGSLNLALGGNTGEAASLAETALLHPNAHFHVVSTVAVVYALDGQWERARELMDQVRTVSPDYGMADFLQILPFRSKGDIDELQRAFSGLKQRTG